MSVCASPAWVDSHCHLDFPAFDADRPAMLARARAAGVADFVVPATTPDTWGRVAALAAEPGVHAAYGLHPWWAGDYRPQHLEMLEDRLASGQAVAVGECGLDFARDIDSELQRQWFVAQMRLAADHGLPVIVHAVRSLDAVMHEISAFPGLSGVVHGFAGSRQQAERCIATGFMLGIGPALTRSARLRDIVRAMPMDALLLETDAPDRPLSGTRGEPADVVAVGEAVSAIRSMASAELARGTSANAKRLFAWETKR
jgi:TatD DNase family protein